MADMTAFSLTMVSADAQKFMFNFSIQFPSYEITNTFETFFWPVHDKTSDFFNIRGAQIFVKPCNLMPLGDKHYSCVCSHFVIA